MLKEVLRNVGNAAVLLIIFLLIFFGIATIALQFSGVQTSLVRKLTASVSETLGYPVEIRKINIKWFDILSLENVVIEDASQRRMIEVERLDVNLDIVNIFKNRHAEIRLDEVTLYKPEVRLVKNPKTGDLNFDEFVARINEITSGGDTTHSDNHIPFRISRASLSEGTFHYDDPREPHYKSETYFDHNHFVLKGISAGLTDFLLVGDTIAFETKGLTAIDRQTNLKVKHLDTRFLFCQKKMELADLQAHIGDSFLKKYISFNYNRAGDFSDFNSRVRMTADFTDSKIQSEDLGLFHEYLLTLRETWHLTGHFDGTVEDFMLSGSVIDFGNGSRLVGDIGFKGLPYFYSSTLDINLNDTHIESADLVQYYPEASLHKLLDKLGYLQLTGSYQGTVTDFDLNGSINTRIGAIRPDLKFHIEDKFKSTYNGSLQTTALDLGILLDNPEVWQKIDFEGEINGEGFDLLTSSVNLDATIRNIGFKHYNYSPVMLNGNLQHSYFNGNVSIADTNLTLDLSGEFDLRNPLNRFDVTGSIGQAKLQTLGFADYPVFLRTDIEAQVEGNTMDDLNGLVKLSQLTLNRDDNDRRLVVDSVLVHAERRNQQRQLKLISDFVNIRMSGNFELSQTFSDLYGLINEYKFYFSKNEEERKAYYSGKSNSLASRPYLITYELKTLNMEPLWLFFDPHVYVAEGAVASGVFRMGATAFMSVEAAVDSVAYGTNKFYDIRSNINTSKAALSDEVLASGYVESKRQKLNMVSATEQMKLEAVWDKDHIDFKGGMQQSDSRNNVMVAGEMTFQKEGFDLHFKNSKLEVLDEVWQLKPRNLVSFKGELIDFKDFSLTSGKQYLTVDGIYSGNGEQDLLLSAGFFRLNTFNTILNTKLDGILDGSLRISNKLRFDELKSAFDIEGLTINDYELGNFRGTSEWDEISRSFLISADLKKNLRNSFTLTGNYFPGNPKEALKLKASFAETELKVIESFVGGIFSDVSGQINGQLNITGAMMKPRISGKLLVNQGRLKVDYLQTYLQVSDTIRVTEQEILADQMTITDSDGNKAKLSGGFYHKDFKDFTMNMQASLNNFKVLNTTDKDNDLFYGTAYVTGTARMSGPIDDILITSNVTSNKGTRIYIPFDGASSVEKKDYIRFVSQLAKEDSTVSGNGTTSAGKSAKIRMNFNFNITSDAYCEIQLDRQAGDIIKAYGSGLISMNVDTDGEFVMNGNYNIERGDYTFTLQNALNKKFDIKSGSRISWSGDPFEAIVNINAGYTQMSSLAGALANYNVSSVDEQGRDPLSRRYPVEVLISLSGRLLTPLVNYSLEIKEAPASGNYRSAVAAFENRLKNDEQEMSRQVSSLLLFNQLLSPSDMLMSSEGFLGNSVSELIANQISSWASAVDENLEVGLTGLSLDQNALTNLQLRFSYRFLNDRFRITRDGRFTYGTAQYDAASLMGEWTLEYWLNSKGTVRGKVYNRNIQNPLILSNTVTTGGVSMQFTHSFNHLGLFRKRNIKEMSKENADIQNTMPSDILNDTIYRTDRIRSMPLELK